MIGGWVIAARVRCPPAGGSAQYSSRRASTNATISSCGQVSAANSVANASRKARLADIRSSSPIRYVSSAVAPGRLPSSRYISRPHLGNASAGKSILATVH